MKYVQVGILIMLVVVAGLLYMVYRGQSQAPVATPATAEQPQVAGEAAPPPPTPKPTPAPAAKPSPLPKPGSPTRETARKPAETGGAATPQPQPPAAATGPSPTASTPASPPAPAPASEPRAATPAPLTPPSGTASAPRTPRKVTIPAGTLISVRLAETLSSEKNQPGDRFTATLDQPLIVEGLILAERGARVEGRVLEVQRAGRVRGLASLKIHLVRLHTADGQEVEIHTEPFGRTAEATTRSDAAKIGAGAAIGAAIGAIAGGGRGAAIGAGVGGAAGTGTVMATRGKPAVLENETRLSFRLQEPVTLVEKIK